MGILSGGIRLRRYQVMGEVPDGFRNRFEEAIERNEFKDFTPGDEREQIVGWVGVDDWFTAGLSMDRWLVGNHTVTLTLRVDTKRIPSKFFKQQCRRTEAEWRLKVGREDLTRAERDEIKTIVQSRLLERVIPACQGHDFVWDMERAELLFWSTAEKANELFRALFERTFGVKLRPLFPYALALRMTPELEQARLDKAVPSSFRPEGGA